MSTIKNLFVSTTQNWTRKRRLFHIILAVLIIYNYNIKSFHCHKQKSIKEKGENYLLLSKNPDSINRGKSGINICKAAHCNAIKIPSKSYDRKNTNIKRNTVGKHINPVSKLSKGNPYEDISVNSIKGVRAQELSRNVQGVQRKLYLLPEMNCRYDHWRNISLFTNRIVTSTTSIKEKVIPQGSEKIAKTPILSRSHGSLKIFKQKSSTQVGQSNNVLRNDKFIHKDIIWPYISHEKVWKPVPKSENDTNSIITNREQQFSASRGLQPSVGSYNTKGSRSEKAKEKEIELESETFNRSALTMGLSGNEDENDKRVLQDVYIYHTNNIRRLSTKSTRKNTRSSRSSNNAKSTESGQFYFHLNNYFLENQDQSTFSYHNISANTNSTDGNDTDISNADRSSDSEISPEGDKEQLLQLFYAKFPVKMWKSFGLFDDSYIESGIDPHWMSFEPPDPIVHNILAILYGIIMIIGCSGNFLVLSMFARCRSLRTPANYLIANLAVSDFLMIAKMPIFIINSVYRGPVLGSIGCKIYGFMGGLTGTASIMTLTAISVDRYYAIVDPLNPFKGGTSLRVILMIMAIWIYSGVFSMIPLLGLNGYVSEGYLTSCSFDYLANDTGSRIFVFVFFVAAWLFPLSVIVFSYSEIFRIVREAERMQFSTDGCQNESFKYKKSATNRRTEIKIAIISSGIILLWGLSWTPYAIVALLGIFGKKKYITPFISAAPALFCKTASCIDPFIYSISHPRFQRELKAKFTVCFSAERNFRGRSSMRDNSVTGTIQASPIPPASFSDTSSRCGTVCLKSNCLCGGKKRGSKQTHTTVSELNAEKYRSNEVDEEIEMGHVSLGRSTKDTKVDAINEEIAEQDCTKASKENTSAEESSESCCWHSEQQQEIILHPCSPRVNANLNSHDYDGESRADFVSPCTQDTGRNKNCGNGDSGNTLNKTGTVETYKESVTEKSLL